MPKTSQGNRSRVWAMRGLLLALGLVFFGVIAFGVSEVSGGPPTIPYGTFLDQLGAGNVASVTFNGLAIDGLFRQPERIAGVNGGAALTAFRSRAPGFGDPALLPELRREHVRFGAASSQWLGTGGLAALGVIGGILLAKPMLLVIAGAFIAGLIRIARGGNMDLGSILARFPMFKSITEKGDDAGLKGGSGRGPPNAARSDEKSAAGQLRTKRSWFRRPVTWVFGIILVLLAIFALVEITQGPASIPYSVVLDQLDAGNVSGVTFSGNRINGRFRKPVSETGASTAGSKDLFLTQIPDLGDPSLLPELRAQHVAIDVVASSSWLSWLGRLPWPLVVFLAAILVAGLIKLVRSKSTQANGTPRARPGQK